MKGLQGKPGAIGLLFLLSLLSGIFWRAELEWRWGWAGLNWLNGSHFSIELICFSFALWLYFSAPCDKAGVRIQRSLIAFFAGILASNLFSIAFALAYDPWEIIWLKIILKSLNISPTENMLMFVRRAALPLTGLIVPLGVCAVAIHYRSALSRHNCWLTPLLFNASFPISILLLELTNHRGQYDVIHTVKSGFVFPGLFFSSGLAFLLEKRRR